MQQNIFNAVAISLKTLSVKSEISTGKKNSPKSYKQKYYRIF